MEAADRTIPIGIPIQRGVGGNVGVEIRSFGDARAVVAQTISGHRRGALARRDGESLSIAARTARDLGIPLVLSLASSGADVFEGVDALHGWGGSAAAVAACSGVVPVLAAVTGPAISGPALLLGLADIVVMTSQAQAFVSGPAMVAEFTGVHVSMEALGGAEMHRRMSGLCAIQTEDVDGAITEVLGFLPENTNCEPPPGSRDDPPDREVSDLRQIVPARGISSYDIRDVVECVADHGNFCELWADWAPQVVTTFARFAGRPVGLVANQPCALAGTLDIGASQKAASFVRFCDAFNLPIVTLVDTPGFLPGKDLEWRGMIRHGAELAFAYAEATVPRICLILRKAFGGAYIVMDSKGLGNDVCLAWPGAEIAVMGAEGAVQILHRRATPEDRPALEVEYRDRYLRPWPAAERGFVDAVIDPAETRSAITSALAMIESKREYLVGRKHDGGPL